MGKRPLRCRDCAQAAQNKLEQAHAAVRELVAKKTDCMSTAAAADEDAALAKRRLPKLDADKKAAAAAKVGVDLLFRFIFAKA